MKYVPIYESILKADGKYLFYNYFLLNDKCDFIKHKIFFDSLTTSLVSTLNIVNIFTYYMHDDIRIEWNK
jgi:hypothetical protein